MSSYNDMINDIMKIKESEEAQYESANDAYINCIKIVKSYKPQITKEIETEVKEQNQ